MGLNHDVTQDAMYAIYVDPENPCNVVQMTYPGWHVEFNNIDENGCLDLYKEYPPLYQERDTIEKWKPQASLRG